MDRSWRRKVIHFFLPFAAIGFAVGLLACAGGYLVVRLGTAIGLETQGTIEDAFLIVCPPSIGLMATEGAGTLGQFFVVIVIATENAILYAIGGLVLSAFWSRPSPDSIPEMSGEARDSSIVGFGRRALVYFFVPATAIGFGIALLLCTATTLLRFDAPISQETIQVMTYISVVACPPSYGLMSSERLGTPDVLPIVGIILIAIANAFLYGIAGLFLALLATFWGRHSARASS